MEKDDQIHLLNQKLLNQNAEINDLKYEIEKSEKKYQQIYDKNLILTEKNKKL